MQLLPLSPAVPPILYHQLLSPHVLHHLLSPPVNPPSSEALSLTEVAHDLHSPSSIHHPTSLSQAATLPKLAPRSQALKSTPPTTDSFFSLSLQRQLHPLSPIFASWISAQQQHLLPPTESTNQRSSPFTLTKGAPSYFPFDQQSREPHHRSISLLLPRRHQPAHRFASAE